MTIRPERLANIRERVATAMRDEVETKAMARVLYTMDAGTFTWDVPTRRAAAIADAHFYAVMEETRT